ncbi:hypothetical protein [Hufsiella ginkgonis]|uniref:Carboxypeptidase-like regulatory domain-containing protein n=1 Tax=Hufsiella ginkgonis TaxID=2695274 RepID=A0A7K1XZD3_9SPHI|nr:hypothetical protein [Hufsiella ginkgonis]MXV16323.1 hypothetical protein [Hufsiella ginkgonis]
MRRSVTLFLALFLSLQLFGQAVNRASLLASNVTLNVSQQRLEDVLNIISKKNNFYFSYGSGIPADSLVSLKAENITVREALNRLLNGRAEYRESEKYIVLRVMVRRFSIRPEEIISGNREYVISGFIVDEQSSEKVKEASVYERNLLHAALSDENGYFRLRFKGDYSSVVLTASKENYRDTSMRFLSSIDILPEGADNPVWQGINTAFRRTGRTFGGWLVSSRQRVQALNIPDFFATTPFQASFLPGLSSHGLFSSQIVNKASLNVLGGYTAGVNGLEVAGIFNVNKHDVEKVQVAGVINMTGGSVKGVQVAGVLNSVFDSIRAVQVAGVLNEVHGNAEGVQVSGVANLVFKDLNGTGITGLVNVVARSTNGIQVAGLGNITGKKLRGAQIAGLFNYAREMHGMQVGLLNVADSSSGYSIGLLNLVRRGYHKVSISANETMNFNIAVKTGNANLYTILIGGKNFSDKELIYSGGFGLGHDVLFSDKLSVAAEISSQFIYLGNWESTNVLSRFKTNVQFKLHKLVSIFAGPAYSVYYSDPVVRSAPGYKSDIVPGKYRSFSNYTTGWFGWNAGITFL